jgi:predicted acylesterase/phospholipase RssA
MLNVEAAVRRRTSRRRLGLALAGGGPLGAFYQLGALHALTECTEGIDLTRLDGYVGVSSGAVLSACLANGLSTDDMIRAFFVEDAAAEYPLSPGVLMCPAFGEYTQRLASLPGLVAEVICEWMKDPLRQSWSEPFMPLLEAIPTGVFDNRPFERYLRKLLTSEGRTNDFRKLPCLLRIVATDLNAGTEVRFGEPGLDDVPISEAIRASTALPGLYTPVKFGERTYVDGALLRTVNASVVLEHGADLVISVNPLVTFDSTAKGASRVRELAKGGLVPVMSQTFRALIQSRMRVGMARYRKLYPFSDRLLFEPNRDDEAMFFANVFRYRERASLAEHAYQCTRNDLRTHARELNPILKRHGVRLRMDRLIHRRRFLTSTAEGRHAENEVIARLDRTLDRLAHWVERYSGA